MMKRLIKLFLCFTISISFAQDSKYINLKIDGLHCANGCARYVQTELNKNDGITALVDFTNKQALVQYDSNIYSDKKIINIINGYQGGKKYRASLMTNDASTCSKGAECCKKTGKPNPSCDNKAKGCCSSAQCSSKKKKRK